MPNSKEYFVEERKKLNNIISFLEFSLKTPLKQVLDEENKSISFDKVKLDREKILDFLKNLYALYTILIIADLTKNKNLIETLEKLKFKFATCLENITGSNIDEDEIFKCILKDKNSFPEVLFISGYGLAYGLELKLSLVNNTQTSTPFVEIRTFSKDEGKLNFLLQKAWYYFLNDKDIIHQFNFYISTISNKLKELKKIKTEIEEFLAKDVLKKVSEEYERKAKEFFPLKVPRTIPVIGGRFFKISKWFLFFTLSLFLILFPITCIFSCHLLNGKTWHDILIKASIGFIPIVVGFYLLRYSLKLRDLQEEYKFKSIMLSSLPALSLLIDDKNERDKIITTILLEASNLQTLTKDKGEVVKEILPIVELANKLKNS